MFIEIQKLCRNAVIVKRGTTGKRNIRESAGGRKAVFLFLVHLPSEDVHKVNLGWYKSVNLLITSICSSVSWTASLC